MDLPSVSELRKPVLIYDASCHKCAATAEELLHAGKGRFEILPIKSATATAILDRAYPKGWEKDIYYVETSSGKLRAHRRAGAAWRVMLKVGFRNFWHAARNLRESRPPSKERPEAEDLTGRRGALRMMLYGAFFMGIGALVGGLGGFGGAIRSVMPAQGGCRTLATMAREDQFFTEQALGDGKLGLLENHLLERGFAANPENAQVSRVACDTDEILSVFVPHTKREEDRSIATATTVRVLKSGEEARVFGATITGDENSREVRHFRVAGGAVEEMESTRISASSCDWNCLWLCNHYGGYSFYSNCYNACTSDPWCGIFFCYYTCWQMCTEQTRPVLLQRVWM